eukprot:jgi/Ulvmu1/6776/UM030_0114.1
MSSSSSSRIALAAVGATAVIAGIAMYTRVIRITKRSPFIKFQLTKYSRGVAPPKPSAVGAAAGGLSVEPERYPEVQRGDVVDDLHGMKVADPYRWLEEPDSEETKSFIEAQNKLSSSVLEKCPGRGELEDLITKLMDYPRSHMPFKRGDRWYYFRNTGLQNQDTLYTCDAPGEEGKVFYDPNTLSEDGTVALSSIQFTNNGHYAAVMLSESGSDWRTVRVLQIDADGETTEMEDVVQHVKHSGVSWTADGLGFLYSAYDKPASDNLGTETDSAVNQKVYYHRLGKPQEEDACLFAEPAHPTWICGASATSDGRWLMLTVSDGCAPANLAFLLDLSAMPRDDVGALRFADYAPADTGTAEAAAAGGAGDKPRLPFKRLAGTFAARWSLIAVDGVWLTLMTNSKAPRNRIVAIDAEAAPVDALTAGKFREVLPQNPRDTLEGAQALKGDVMVVQWLRDVLDVAEVRRISDGALLATVPLPTLGTMSGISTEPLRASTEFWFSLTGFVEPSTIFRADAAPVADDGDDSKSKKPAKQGKQVPEVEPAVFQRTALSVPHNPDECAAKQVFVTSKDGTRVPMFIVHRKAAPLGPKSPALLYGYGGFNIPLQPSFSASRLAWLRAFDGCFAVANLRGGGEYGRQWRDDGSLMRKQNVFDDFQACAEHLVRGGYTSPAALTIQGGSNGGLLVAACANQRPDLYACILAQVGVMDMLRFHKFTVGHAWCSDFGNPDEAEAAEYLLGYSPLHNVRLPDEGQYPAMLLLTASHDDRVSPLHTFKLTAELQHRLVKCGDGRQSNPLAARIDTKAGHGAGKPTAKVIQEVADMLAFAAAASGATMKQQQQPQQ